MSLWPRSFWRVNGENNLNTSKQFSFTNWRQTQAQLSHLLVCEIFVCMAYKIFNFLRQKLFTKARENLTWHTTDQTRKFRFALWYQAEICTSSGKTVQPSRCGCLQFLQIASALLCSPIKVRNYQFSTSLVHFESECTTRCNLFQFWRNNNFNASNFLIFGWTIFPGKWAWKDALMGVVCLDFAMVDTRKSYVTRFRAILSNQQT